MLSIGPVLLLLACAGFLISSYFTAVARRWIRPDAAWLPRLCRIDSPTCAAVVFTPAARLLGLRNSVLGQLFYAALGAAIVSEWLFAAPVYQIFVVASLVTVGMAMYLSYALLFVLRLTCWLCFAAHTINIAIACLLLLGSPAR